MAKRGWWFAIALFLAVPALAQEVDPDRRAVFQGAMATLDREGPAAAIGFLEGRPDPLRAVTGFGDAMNFLYWRRHDLGSLVALARAGIEYGTTKGAELREDEPERAHAVLSATKALCYDLGSHTWPGWDQPGVAITEEFRKEGLRSAGRNLAFAESLEKGPKPMSSAYWLLGAQLLADGDAEAAREAFEKAAGFAKQAEDEEARLMCEAYAGLAELVEGRKDTKRMRSSLLQLDLRGSKDAAFYADQVRVARVVFRGLGPGVNVWREVKVEVGPLTLEIALSRTAQVFHVVDQLSRWSPYCHGQYRRHFTLSPEDEAALAAYAEVRKEKGWGGGLEERFYDGYAIDEALFHAVAEDVLSPEQMETVRRALARFAPRIDAFTTSGRSRLTAFVGRIDAAALLPFATSMAKLTGVEELSVPVYPILSPAGGSGGGMNGGRLTVEVTPDEEPDFLLRHELAHAFLDERKDLLARTAAKAEGLTTEILGEGLCYAIAPGLFFAGAESPLAKRVAEHRARGEGLADGGYPAFRIYGLALVPVLKQAFAEGKELPAVLARAAEIWTELAAKEGKEPREVPHWFAAGPAWEAATARAKATGRYGGYWTYNHLPAHYAEIRRKARPGDTVVLLLAADNSDQRVPGGFEDLYPVPPGEALQRALEGETVAVVGEARGLRVVLLAAPTLTALRALVAGTELLAK